jgi:transporter family-2 protein
MQVLLIAFAAVAGLLNTIQTGTNATLNKSLGAPVWAAAAVGTATFLTTLLAALTVMQFAGQRPTAEAIANVPWWAWTGGVLGAVYVLATVLVADKVGAAIFMGVTITVAIVVSLAMDHFGLLGFEVHKAGLARIVGGLFMLAGLGLIAKF